MKESWTRKEVAEITGIPERRVLFYSEQTMLPGLDGAVGRGTARKYYLKHLFLLSVIKELDLIGFSLARIKQVIILLYVQTLNPLAGRGMKTIERLPTIWVDGTFTKEPVIMLISLARTPAEHRLSPDSKNYNNEMFLDFTDGSDEIKALAAKHPASIVLNLNKIFNNLGLNK